MTRITNRLILLSIALLFSFNLSAQKWAVEKETKLPVKGYYPDFDPYRNGIVFSSESFKGLWYYTISESKKIKLSDDLGAGYNPTIKVSEIVTRSKKNSKIVAHPFPLKDPLMITRIERDNYTVKSSPDLSQILVYANSGEIIKKLQPVGKGDYLNISVSPDNSRLIFRVSGLGTFISDLNGEIIHKLGDVEFPSWLDNDTVIYTNTTDDGYNYISSEVLLKDLDTQQELVLSDKKKHVALYPKVDSQKNQLIYHTTLGDIYLVDLIKK